MEALPRVFELVDWACLRNICGNRALVNEELVPSGECIEAKVSNSVSSALNIFRYSKAVLELGSKTQGMDRPSNR